MKMKGGALASPRSIVTYLSIVAKLEMAKNTQMEMWKKLPSGLCGNILSQPKIHDLWECGWCVVYLVNLKSVWHHYVQQQPPTAVLAIAKAILKTRVFNTTHSRWLQLRDKCCRSKKSPHQMSKQFLICKWLLFAISNFAIIDKNNLECCCCCHQWEKPDQKVQRGKCKHPS